MTTKKNAFPSIGPSLSVSLLISIILASANGFSNDGLFFFIVIFIYTAVGTFLLYIIHAAIDVSYTASKEGPTAPDARHWAVIKNRVFEDEGINYSVPRSRLIKARKGLDTRGGLVTPVGYGSVTYHYLLIDQLTNVPFVVKVVSHGLEGDLQKDERGVKVEAWHPIVFKDVMSAVVGDMFPMRDHGLDLNDFTYPGHLSPHQRAELAEFSHLA